MKTVIKLAVMLVIAGSNFVWADDGGDQSKSVQLAPSLEEASPAMRVMTEREFDGIDPISIKVNQEFIIPIHYERALVSNDVTIFFGPHDSNVIKVVGDGASMSPDGKFFDINLVCTGKQAGQETVSFGEGGKIGKQFSIQVVE